MKGAIISLFIGILLISLFLFKTVVGTKNGTIDIQWHDTYYILSYLGTALFIFLILSIFFSIGGMIGTRFKDNRFTISFIAFALGVLLQLSKFI